MGTSVVSRTCSQDKVVWASSWYNTLYLLFSTLRKSTAFFLAPRGVLSLRISKSVRQVKGLCGLTVCKGARFSALGSTISWFSTLGRVLTVAELF